MKKHSTSGVSLPDIVAARLRLNGAITHTPCSESPALSELTGSQVFCKQEHLQRTGSFKERGARNALAQLSPSEAKRGVIAASAGNHALGLAWHGRLLDIPVTVVMPRFAPLVKVARCRRFGANVVLHGDTYDEARAEALRLVEDRELTYIHPFDDPKVIAGQGTLAFEILEQVPDAEAIVVPVGGGGLLAGMATVLRAMKPDLEIIGVEPSNAPCFAAGLAASGPVRVPTRFTLADGLAVAEAGRHTLEIARPLVNRIVSVSEEALALAILRLAELEKCVIEGAGAAGLAALISGCLPDLQGKRVVLLLTGGNIDLLAHSRVIERGLATDGRLFRFDALISDRPGGLAHLSGVLAAAGANVTEIVHNRTFGGPDFSTVHVLCTVETRDREHITAIQERLAEEGVELFTERKVRLRIALLVPFSRHSANFRIYGEAASLMIGAFFHASSLASPGESSPLHKTKNMAKITKTTTKAAPAPKRAAKPAAENGESTLPTKAKRITTPAPEKPATAAKPAVAVKLTAPRKKAPRPKPTNGFTQDDIALRAYFIAEKRQAEGRHGDPHSDWVEAERQLRLENGLPA